MLCALICIIYIEREDNHEIEKTFLLNTLKHKLHIQNLDILQIYYNKIVIL